MRGSCSLIVLALSACLFPLSGCYEDPGPADVLIREPVAEACVHPAIFAEISFDEAMAQMDGCADKVLLVDGVTSWCCPCKGMDKTTWQDERVVSWLEENALVIQVDCEADTKFQEAHSVYKYPTFLVFRDGEVIARDFGAKTADEMLAWLESLPEEGSSLAETPEEEPAEPDADEA